VVPYKRFEQSMETYPNVRRWFDAIKTRPAVQRGMEVEKALRPAGEMTDAQRKIMFGQTGASVRGLQGKDS